jgi:hypothetical protein
MGQPAQPSLDGWGPYKFGMTLDDVKAVPGITWNYIRPIDLQKFHKTLNASLSSTHANAEEGGLTFRFAGLFFNSDNKLIAVTLMQNIQDQCESTYQNVLRDEENKYGSFGPHEHPPLPSVITSSVDNVPGGTSRYEYTEVQGPGAGYPIFSADTWRSFDSGRTMRVRMVGSDQIKAGCQLSLAFQSQDNVVDRPD